eukprot:scaffold206864_cov51-Attheya_sp.AAC.1
MNYANAFTLIQTKDMHHANKLTQASEQNDVLTTGAFPFGASLTPRSPKRLPPAAGAGAGAAGAGLWFKRLSNPTGAAGGAAGAGGATVGGGAAGADGSATGGAAAGVGSPKSNRLGGSGGGTDGADVDAGAATGRAGSGAVCDQAD